MAQPETHDDTSFIDAKSDNNDGKSTDDNFVPPPRHRRALSFDHLIAKVPETITTSPSENARSNFSGNLSGNADQKPGHIDTTAPIASVKEAVSKFGGIVDWKAHRVQTVERRKFIEIELQKAKEEMPIYKKQCETAEEAKSHVIKELDGTKRLIEELKLNLERAQKEEQQAKQDTELAKLRVEEIEQGIADESSYAAKAQLEVAKARHAAAVYELKTVKDEHEQLRKDYDVLVAEKKTAAKKAEKAVSDSREVEKSVEDLTIELIALKQSLESAHSEHLEAEEHRFAAVIAKEQDNLSWEEELKEIEDEIEKINQKILSANDLRMKLKEASVSLQELKGELGAYMGTKEDKMDSEGNFSGKKNREQIQTGITEARKELAEVKLRIEKVNSVKMESSVLKTELEKEKTDLREIQEREDKSSSKVASVEKELKATESEIETLRIKEKEENEKMVGFPKKVEEAGQEAEQAKAFAVKAREELLRVKEEAEKANEGKMNKENELRSVQKEIEAANAAEKLALAAINALEESESARKRNEDSPVTGITLTLEEYYDLTKRAHDAEEEANAKVITVISEIEMAKGLEKKTMNTLEEIRSQISERKDQLVTAKEKAEEAEKRKEAAEQELWKSRAEHEQRRKAAANQSGSGKGRVRDLGEKDMEGTDLKSRWRKKRSLIPKFFMFLGRKKTPGTRKD